MQEETRSQSDIYETIVFKPDETSIELEKARELTSRSFLITLKERLSNLIMFSSLFLAREHMFQRILINSSKSEEIRLNKLPKTISTKPNTDIEKPKPLVEAASSLTGNEPKPTWKTKLPNMFMEMEHLLTPSYRDTVQQTIVSASFLKKRLKKSTKKSSEIEHSASVSSQKANLKRVTSSKTERKNSAILVEE